MKLSPLALILLSAIDGEEETRRFEFFDFVGHDGTGGRLTTDTRRPGAEALIHRFRLYGPINSAARVPPLQGDGRRFESVIGPKRCH